MSSEQLLQKTDIKLSVKQTFGFESDMKVGAFSKKNEYVPKIDPDYKFDKDTTLAILAGFSFNKRVLIQGYHGTGKSTHIEQVAARLNWPCVRVNLDSHISRIDLIGKDAIVLKDGKQMSPSTSKTTPLGSLEIVASSPKSNESIIFSKLSLI